MGGVILLIILIAKLLMSTTAFNSIYSALILLVAQNSFNCRSKIIEALGEHSLNIWLVHAFLLSYVAKYHYDILALAAILLFSYLLSLLINVIAKPVEEVIALILKKADA